MPPATFPSTPILDTFNRANEGPPMTGWTDLDLGFKVVSNQCQPNSTNVTSYFSTSIAGPDQEAFVTLALIQGLSDNYLLLRWDPSTGGIGSGYAVRYREAATDFLELYRFDAGSGTLFDLYNPSGDLSNGDKFGIRCAGYTIEAWVRRSGVWEKVGIATDAIYSGAAPNNKAGLRYNHATLANGLYDDFGGGVVSNDNLVFAGAGGHLSG